MQRQVQIKWRVEGKHQLLQPSYLVTTGISTASKEPGTYQITMDDANIMHSLHSAKYLVHKVTGMLPANDLSGWDQVGQVRARKGASRCIGLDSPRCLSGLIEIKTLRSRPEIIHQMSKQWRHQLPQLPQQQADRSKLDTCSMVWQNSPKLCRFWFHIQCG